MGGRVLDKSGRAEEKAGDRHGAVRPGLHASLRGTPQGRHVVHGTVSDGHIHEAGRATRLLRGERSVRFSISAS